MCGQYAIVSKIEKIEKSFNVQLKEGLEFESNKIIIPGTKGLVITDKNPRIIQDFIFGFTPTWADKLKYIINARAEGDHNKENSPDYTGGKGIINKPFFRKAIRSQRCLVIADSFIESTGKKELKKSYNVYLKEYVNPIAFAGIWDTWQNKETGEIHDTFAIITTRPNQLMLKIPHERMPVILKPSMFSRYLSTKSPLSDITAMLEPYPAKDMNAYEIATSFYNERNDARKALQPYSQRLDKEYHVKLKQQLKLFGMGESPSREKKAKR
jgi:putative SOS response-associated peptidase YedK